jgi:hypothetical protein
MNLAWTGVLAPLDTPSADRRLIRTPAPGADWHEPLPLPLRLERNKPPAGFEVLLVGWIDKVAIDDGKIIASGRIVTEPGPDDGPVDAEGAQFAARLLGEGIELAGGVELLATDVDDSGVAKDPDERPLAVVDWRLLQFVVYEPGVREPSFPEARIREANHWSA